MMEIEMVIVRSSFLQPDAAPEAMAAEVPQTLVADAIVMMSGLLSILSTLVPNHHINRITIGVTTQAIPRPYRPNLAMLENSTEKPIITRPVLM